jgi:DNA polymerase-4
MPVDLEKIRQKLQFMRKNLRELQQFAVMDLKQFENNSLYEAAATRMLQITIEALLDIYNRIRGIDNRKINTERKRKSLGTEHTFRNDTKDRDVLKKYLHRFAIDLASSLGKRQLYCRTITLKIKDENFKLRTKSKTSDSYIDSVEEISQIGMYLLDEIDVCSNIRLIGLTVSNFATVAIKQLSLFD